MMLHPRVEVIAIIGFACLVVGYLFGHHIGKRFGIKLGAALAAISLRQETLLLGRCQICGADSDINAVEAEEELRIGEKQPCIQD